jgi:hypothetical protein
MSGAGVSIPPKYFGCSTYLRKVGYKDESKFGEYRTKRVILEIFDAMQRAIDTGEPYQTLLDPPPADPRVAHPPRENLQIPFREARGDK